MALVGTRYRHLHRLSHRLSAYFAIYHHFGDGIRSYGNRINLGARSADLYDPPEYTNLIGFGHFLGVPVSFEIAIALMLIGSFILRRTVFGRYTYAIGSNTSAAVRSGIPVAFYTMLVYAFAGFSSGVAAIILTAWVNAAQPVAEPDMTLRSIAAVVLGGIALTGGSGGMIHVLYGCIILGALANSMTMVGVSSYYQILAIGIVIILAVMLDRFRRRRL